MAVDKLVDSAQLDSDLGDVADAIRAKSGGSSPLAFPLGFISEIEGIETGGGSGVATYELFRDMTLDEDVNTIKIDFTSEESDYNVIYALVTSPQGSPTFPYVNVNTTSGGSYVSNASLSRFVILPNPTNMQTGAVIGGGVDFTYPISYIYIRSHYASNLFLTGTRIRMWGATIENL